MPTHSSRTQPSPRSDRGEIEIPDVVIRCARTSDAALIAPLFDAYRQFYGAPSDVSAARHFLLERLARSESVVFLATAAAGSATADGVRGESVGFAQLYPSFSSVALRPIIVLNDLYVSPSWRGAKVARRLVQEVVAYAVRLHAARVELSTAHTNSVARRLYASMNFVPDAEFTHLSLALPITSAPS